ncbi:MAG: C39 family peptidase [bacterium]|nr:C39 family peptidase [bacterium]
MDQESQRGWLTRFRVPLLFLLVILIGAIGFYFYTSYEPPVNHLIEGVPYYGVFNLYPDYTSSAISIATILRYYHDERVSFKELKNEFPDSRHDDDNLSNFQKSLKFFEGQGYKTFSINLRAQNYKGNEVNEIKKFIKKDIPVIVIQQKRLDTKSDDIEKFGWRVVIGVFDDKKEVIVHDASLGNNYVFSYSDFEKLFVPGASRMLVAWPKDTLAPSLPKLGNGLPYPKRSMVMENAYAIIGAAGRARAASATADALCRKMPDNPTSEQINEYIMLNKESIRYRDEVISSPAFELMPPLFQFRNKLWRAKSLRNTGDVSKAREIFINELIPANKDLNQTTEGFEFVYDMSADDDESRRSEKIINGQMPYLYEMIMRTYQFEGRYKEAINAYMPYFKLDPDSEYALKALSELRDPILRERVPRHVKCMGGKNMIK